MAPPVGAFVDVNKMSRRYKPNLNLQQPPIIVVNVNVSVDIPDLLDLSRGSSPTKGVCTAVSPTLSQKGFAKILKQQDKENPFKQRLNSTGSQYCVNKDNFSTDTIRDIAALPDAFLEDQENPYKPRLNSTGSQYCVNKDDYSTDSLKEIFALPVNFLNDSNEVTTANSQLSNYGSVSRRFSADSLRELNELPSISTDTNQQTMQCVNPFQNKSNSGGGFVREEYNWGGSAGGSSGSNVDGSSAGGSGKVRIDVSCSLDTKKEEQRRNI